MLPERGARPALDSMHAIQLPIRIDRRRPGPVLRRPALACRTTIRASAPGRPRTPSMPSSRRPGSAAAAPGRYCAVPPWPVERPSAPAHPAGPAGALAPLRRKDTAPALPGLSVPWPTLLLGGDDADHLQALVGVAPLVVVPGHQLDEGRVELDAGVGI